MMDKDVIDRLHPSLHLNIERILTVEQINENVERKEWF